VLILLLWLAAGLVLPAAPAADSPPTGAQPLAGTLETLAAEIEHLVARTKPAGWENERSCLYYALAGQHLLAQRGIASTLRVGAVIYDPGTSTRHGISPHAWLETPTHFIDPATLPRWGEITVVPLELVVTSTSQVIPGRTMVLVRRRPGDPQLTQYLADHRRRFERAASRPD
jgi:hypothetical protein